MTIKGQLQGDPDGCTVFAASILFTALSTNEHLAKRVLCGLNLIGGWLPVSILFLILLVFPN